MATEIERKFLLNSAAWQQDVEESFCIRQGYFPSAPGCTVRIRTMNDRAFLTIKGPTRDLARSEYEYEIPLTDAVEMLDLFCRGRQLDKVRHLVRCGGHLWEVDVFSGDNAGLEVAEIELDSAAEEFERPEWLGAEVSANPAYRNMALVFNPYKNWKDKA